MYILSFLTGWRVMMRTPQKASYLHHPLKVTLGTIRHVSLNCVSLKRRKQREQYPPSSLWFLALPSQVSNNILILQTNTTKYVQCMFFSGIYIYQFTASMFWWNVLRYFIAQINFLSYICIHSYYLNARWNAKLCFILFFSISRKQTLWSSWGQDCFHIQPLGQDQKQRSVGHLHIVLCCSEGTKPLYHCTASLHPKFLFLFSFNYILK